MTGARVEVIASPKTWMESEAVQQLQTMAALPGVVRAVGMPDLHPGKGAPIGSVCACVGWVYPYLIGNDIGCGMGLWRTDLRRKAVKLDRWERRLVNMDGPWAGDAAAWLVRHAVESTAHDVSLGTIGLGNHFAEVQSIEEIVDTPAATALGLDSDRLLVLVHSGSRGFGEAILRAHVDRFASRGLADGTDDQAAYLVQHAHACAWAQASRALIARRIMDAIGADGNPLLDVSHNTVELAELEGAAVWLHRKGATPADRGPVVIAGTRGTLSYVVLPQGDGQINLQTLAHGAGRKWKRSEARGRLEGHFGAQDLVRTALGGRVICADKALLYEEAPQAYKDVDRVVNDLVAAGAARVIATLRPWLTYKTRGRPR